MAKRMRFRVVIEKDEESGGWVAQCVEIPGAISQGETLEEVTENIADAISELLTHREDEARRQVETSPSKGSRLRTVEVLV